MLESALVTAQAAAEQMIAAGVPERDLLWTISRACLHGPVVAWGYQGVAVDDEPWHQAQDRKRVRRQFWRTLERTDENFEYVEAAAKVCFERFVRWESGKFTWSLSEPERSESWDSVLFEKASFDAWLGDRAKAVPVGVDTVETWIEKWLADRSADMKPSGKNLAWAAFKKEFGARPWPKGSFVELFVRKAGNRKQGRPKAAKS